MKSVVLLGALALVFVFLSCQGASKALGIPLPEIVGATARESFGLDYQVHIDCTVKNNGAGGNITIAAELRKGGFWKKEQEVFIGEDATRMVTLIFSEPTFLDGGLTSGEYQCSARS